jgi:hypothetical protein
MRPLPVIPAATWAALAWAALAPAVAAQAVAGGSDTVDVQGAVTPVCLLGSADPSSVAFGGLADTVGIRVGRLTGMTERQILLPGSFCNYAGTRLTVTAQAMVADGGPPPPGFAKAVNFTAGVAGWAGADAEATTTAAADGSAGAATGQSGVQGAPKSADLTLTLSNFSAPGDAPLAAGAYAGWVTVTLGPDLAFAGPGAPL